MSEGQEDKGRTVVITTDERSLAMLIRTIYQVEEDSDHADTRDEFCKVLGGLIGANYDIEDFNHNGDRFLAIARIDGEDEPIAVEHVCDG